MLIRVARARETTIRVRGGRSPVRYVIPTILIFPTACDQNDRNGKRKGML
jgi:hypothetical protein